MSKQKLHVNISLIYGAVPSGKGTSRLTPMIATPTHPDDDPQPNPHPHIFYKDLFEKRAYTRLVLGPFCQVYRAAYFRMYLG